MFALYLQPDLGLLYIAYNGELEFYSTVYEDWIPSAWDNVRHFNGRARHYEKLVLIGRYRA